jgi:3-hydroxyisobutyrate dehydrogenase-like beta-hydroxyacid dehydrogenase
MLNVCLVGFGEAGAAFAGADGWQARARAYDKLTDDPATRAPKEDDYRRAGVEGCADPAEALAQAELILSLVTADQSLAAAADAAQHVKPGALFCDMNSVAPATKAAAAVQVERGGARYVDVAIMSPVYPGQLNVPLLVSGPHADAGAEALRAIGFTNVRVVPGDVGRASSIKMIRSVVVKGLEALTTECVLAADAAGVLDEVIASLDASWPGTDWGAKADYNLERMMAHGLRRAAEMSESTRTLLGLGISPMMTEGTVNWQQGIGELGIAAPDGLCAKLEAIKARRKELGA